MDEPGSQITFSIADIIQPFTFSALLGIIAMLVLLLVSALVSGSEIAFFSLTAENKEQLESNPSRFNKVISSLLEHPQRLLATILIGNNFVNVAIIILSTFVINQLFNFTYYPTLGFIFQVVIVTFLILLIGEIVPKIYANQNAMRLATFMAYPIFILDSFLKLLGVNTLLVRSTSLIKNRLNKQNNSISVDELSHALELTQDQNTSSEEHKILKGIVNFGNTDVKQIMTPRIQVEAIEVETEFEQVIERIVDSAYSRIPVYNDSFDKVVGILYIKDLLPHLHEPSFNWQTLLREPFYVPENKKIDDLLKEFQERKIHLAIVVDEFGGTSGIVSLEDILEEIVGEISDEFDDDEIIYSKLDNQTYIFEGQIALTDMYRVLDIEGDEFEASKGDSETLGGFLTELEGKIPRNKERIKFNNFEFVIEAADKRKVKRVKLKIKSPDEQN